MNLPNRLTLARLLLIPVFLLVISHESLYTDAIAAAVFVLSAATDGLDGYYARKNKQVTSGQIYGPAGRQVANLSRTCRPC